MYRGCVSDGFSLTGSVPAATANCTYGIVSHTDTSLVLRSARGIGTNRIFSVSFTEGILGDSGGQNVIMSNTLVWNYDPPTIANTIPSVMAVADAENTS